MQIKLILLARKSEQGLERHTTGTRLAHDWHAASTLHTPGPKKSTSVTPRQSCWPVKGALSRDYFITAQCNTQEKFPSLHFSKDLVASM